VAAAGRRTHLESAETGAESSRSSATRSRERERYLRTVQTVSVPRLEEAAESLSSPATSTTSREHWRRNPESEEKVQRADLPAPQLLLLRHETFLLRRTGPRREVSCTGSRVRGQPRARARPVLCLRSVSARGAVQQSSHPARSVRRFEQIRGPSKARSRSRAGSFPAAARSSHPGRPGRSVGAGSGSLSDADSH